ncbi:aconitase X swivel domain-containing protein [Sapientia aquatica]|uniref:DUF126 domain-containing protein n=1 Tax=Sapientia aquatica TaxID=1549640 RepID=A0A4R5VRR3_9BURK|nr:DUF126 domain-containing protein [Sapientia aquatica]TDK60461.1 DUF126 domain-containing protein [Sapientia aquatica]
MNHSEVILNGKAQGELLVLTEALSFWGGTDISTGRIIDRYHPQVGKLLAGRIVVLPGVKGSTAGTGALLEMLCAGVGPAGFILRGPDIIVTAACQIANNLIATTVPVLRIPDLDFSDQSLAGIWNIDDDQIFIVQSNSIRLNPKGGFPNTKQGSPRRLTTGS